MDSRPIRDGKPRLKRCRLLTARTDVVPGARIKRLQLMREEALARLEPPSRAPGSARAAP